MKATIVTNFSNVLCRDLLNNFFSLTTVDCIFSPWSSSRLSGCSGHFISSRLGQAGPKTRFLSYSSFTLNLRIAMSTSLGIHGTYCPSPTADSSKFLQLNWQSLHARVDEDSAVTVTELTNYLSSGLLCQFQLLIRQS